MHVGIKDAARRSLEWVSNNIKVLDGKKKKYSLGGTGGVFTFSVGFMKVLTFG